GGNQVVDRQTVLAHQIADPAAEGDPADPDRGGIAEASGQAVLGGRGRVLARGQPTFGGGDSAHGVDLQSLQFSKVEDDPAVGGAVAGQAVATVPEREFQPGLPSQGDDPADVLNVCCADDGRWSAVVENRGDGEARRVVVDVLGHDDATADGVAQRRNRKVRSGHVTLLLGTFAPSSEGARPASPAFVDRP